MSDKKTLTLKQVDPTKERVVTWPVEVSTPADGGTVVKSNLDTNFLILTQERINELTTDTALRAFALDTSKPTYASPLLWEVVKGFPNFREDDGGAVVETARAISLLLNESAVAVALQSAYFAMVNGRAAKN